MNIVKKEIRGVRKEEIISENVINFLIKYFEEKYFSTENVFSYQKILFLSTEFY
jgi:hypothetical protein